MATRRRENGDGCLYFHESRKQWIGTVQIGFNESGKPKRKSFSGKDKGEVKKKLTEYKRKMASEGVPSSNILTSDYLEDWFKNFKLGAVKSTHYDRLESIYKNHIKPELGYYQLHQISADKIQKLINKMAINGYSLSSIKKILEVLRPSLKKAVILNYITKNPTDGVELPKQDQLTYKRKIINIYSKAQVITLENSIKELSANSPITTSNYYYPIFIFILNTGIREGEALALKWSDVHISKDNSYIIINKSLAYIKERDREGNSVGREHRVTSTKTSNGYRKIPLNRNALFALDLIKANLNKLGISSEYVVGLNDTHLTPSKIIYGFTRLTKSLNIPNYGIHSLRHTFASMLIITDCQIKVLSEILGHSDTSFTYKTYIHIFMEQKVNCVNLLNDIYN